MRKAVRLLFWGDRIHPIWRTTLYLLGILGAEFSGALFLSVLYLAYLLMGGSLPAEGLQALGMGIPRWLFLGQAWWRLAVALGWAFFLGHFLDREPPATMGWVGRRLWRDGTVGAVFGMVTMGITVGAFVALGWAVLSAGTAGPADLLVDLIALLPAAVAEEIAFRGYALRALAEWRGPAVGVVVSSLLFAAFHALNPNVNPLGLFNIFLAGIVFAVAVERTGTLWLASGYHFLWNLAQGTLLGLPVSGMAWEGLLRTSVEGPAVWTGGSFGPEGGLVASLVLLVSAIPLWLLTRTPATVAVACRNQRAELESRFGPLPHRHRSLEGGRRLFGDLCRAPVRGRMGEVALVLQRPDGSVLLHTKGFYVPGTYRLPTGGIHPGERVMDAARREVEEETGLRPGEVRPLGLLTYTVRYRRGRCFFHSWVVLVPVEGKPTVREGSEDIQGFRWVRPEDLRDVAAELRSLQAGWAAWGRFRAEVHELAAEWLRQCDGAGGAGDGPGFVPTVFGE